MFIKVTFISALLGDAKPGFTAVFGHLTVIPQTRPHMGPSCRVMIPVEGNVTLEQAHEIMWDLSRSCFQMPEDDNFFIRHRDTVIEIAQTDPEIAEVEVED